MARLQLSEQAQIDVDDIYDYISRRERRPITADRVVDDLFSACDGYASAYAAGSQIGTSMPDFGPDYRTFTHKRWVIVFRPLDDGIEIMRVLDASRDYPRLFPG